jgi:hypothetical protein
MRGRLAAGIITVVISVGLAGCTTGSGPGPTNPSLTSAPAPTATPTPTPIDGLPNDHTLSTVNDHVAADAWAFIATATGNPIGVRINGLWQGQPGSHSDRSYAQASDQTPVDVTAAVPYFLSWSYVVLDGDGDAAPAAIVLPAATGTLYNVSSPFADHDCPDYRPAVAQGVGFLVTRCAVSLSPDGAYPIGLAFAVPHQDKQYWFLDAPAAVPQD